MNILETKEKLTLNELLRIAYTYGNMKSTAILPPNYIREKK